MGAAGLTLVGFGTSTPELVTSIQAALADSPGIAYGNNVGSNIADILLILGLSAIMAPIAIATSALKRDGMVMIAVACVFAALAFVLPMGRVIGAAFLVALATHVVHAFRKERGSAGEHGAAYDKSLALQSADPALAPRSEAVRSLPISLVIAIGGLVVVVVGGSFLVVGAVNVARDFGISETVIGLTIVAVGTSMPEFVTSVVASIRKQSDVAFGSIIGSNIYNIVGIGGATALIAPGGVPAEIVRFDNLVMIAVSVLVIVLAASGRRIT